MVEVRHAEEESPATLILEDIRRRVRLPRNITAQDALSAVMCTFSQHVSRGEARQVFGALPAQVQPFLERCMVHRHEEASRFDRDALLRRISEHLGVPIPLAEEITSAVLRAISSRLPAREVADVASQLPKDLKAIWVVPRAPLAPPTAQHPVLVSIERSTRLPRGVTGEGAFKVVTCQLSKRLSLGEARHFIRPLPSELRQLVDECMLGRGEHPETFDKETFLSRVAKDLRMEGDLSGAEEIARKVFRAMEEYVPADVFKHVLSQLPRGLGDLWALPERP